MATKKAARVKTATDPVVIPQPRALKKVDELKTRLLGTDREDHWQIALEMEKEIKQELLKQDLMQHQGLRMLIEWMVGLVRDTNALLTLAKSDELSSSQRDGLIEKREFILALVKFLDPSGKRLRELEAELDYQLEDPQEGVDIDETGL